ncbi:type II toxin-antitoxin system RelE family toxin [Methanolobus bombayensis]|jgi:mRNA interferase RelE/StbE|uniref:type II toxin-antitoxin system RelE family toxin n=1 Tax=Methanolobus bombayensis TaxID=38023 RepID=UPI003CC9216A|nr:mRNA interferase RelE/StbE [Methanolobus bombayensis]
MKNIVHSIEHMILVEPFSGDTKRLQCFDYFRYRLGKYRVVFDVDVSGNVVFYAVDHRSSIYNKLRHRFKRC